MENLAMENLSVTTLANDCCPQTLSYYFQHKSTVFRTGWKFLLNLKVCVDK